MHTAASSTKLLVLNHTQTHPALKSTDLKEGKAGANEVCYILYGNQMHSTCRHKMQHKHNLFASTIGVRTQQGNSQVPGQ